MSSNNGSGRSVDPATIEANMTFSAADGPIGCRSMKVSQEEYERLVAASRPMHASEVAALVHQQTTLIDWAVDTTNAKILEMVEVCCWPAED